MLGRLPGIYGGMESGRRGGEEGAASPASGADVSKCFAAVGDAAERSWSPRATGWCRAALELHKLRSAIAQVSLRGTGAEPAQV
ncbi:hypothetical protein NDU88_005679 [Pleurodeles waltl]|uniref:Uncharacterized protein n=1 Tax=Pleurodeles waltl TaxID=8319 RepID=A0AAV7MB64_PLEWA|nr:hypothetical protein NDU88_005679 [Pleurodeles waltl]